MKKPIALFVFNRPNHTLHTLESLSLNPEFCDSQLYIFCDGARSERDLSSVTETRSTVKNFPHPNKIIYESPVNKGLSASLAYGISHVLNEHESLIVIEDDLVVSQHFLQYMNSALEIYADSTQVMQVSGYMFPVQTNQPLGSSFLPFPTSWGWATWRRAWAHMNEDRHLASSLLKRRCWRHRFDLGSVYPYSRMLNNRLKNKNNSWAVWFYFSLFNNSGLVLYPNTTLVKNSGFDGSGTHCKAERLDSTEFALSPVIEFPEKILVDKSFYSKVKKSLKVQRGALRNFADWLWRAFGRTVRCTK